MIWLIMYLDKCNREHVVGAYPSAEEAQQVMEEEYGDKRESWRYISYGVDPALLSVEGRPLVG